jgi:hypothetical protein
MKIAFVGSREFIDKEFVVRKVDEYLHIEWVDYAHQVLAECVSGGASGVDSWAEETAKTLGAKCTIFLPDWDKHGKSAGFIRNKDIIMAADFVVAFWDGKSKGTKSSIDLAINAGKPVDVFIRTGISGS